MSEERVVPCFSNSDFEKEINALAFPKRFKEALIFLIKESLFFHINMNMASSNLVAWFKKYLPNGFCIDRNSYSDLPIREVGYDKNSIYHYQILAFYPDKLNQDGEPNYSSEEGGFLTLVKLPYKGVFKTLDQVEGIDFLNFYFVEDKDIVE